MPLVYPAATFLDNRGPHHHRDLCDINIHLLTQPRRILLKKHACAIKSIPARSAITIAPRLVQFATIITIDVAF